MDSTIIVALISGACTLVGTYAGIRKSTSLTNYRIQQLEEKVAKHNSVVERTFRLEEKVDVANHRIADLEDFQKGMEEVRIEH